MDSFAAYPELGDQITQFKILGVGQLPGGRKAEVMALTRFGFIVTGDSFIQYQGTDKFSMKVVGVSQPEDGIAAAKEMVSEGIQLIELCGGFSPVLAGKIIEAIEYAVPVGVVAYGPESINAMHRLFSK